MAAALPMHKDNLAGWQAIRGEELEVAQLSPAKVASFAKTIEETSQRIAKIVNGLRTISRSSGKDPCIESSVIAIIAGTLAICASRAKYAEIKVTVEQPQTALTIECRAAEISQVLLNLLGNAMDAIETLSEKWIKIGVKDVGPSVDIVVEDSGHGILSELREKILQPFFTTKEVGKGTGLGLSISKSLVEDHNGQFELDSSVPNTRFIVRLPKKQPD